VAGTLPPRPALKPWYRLLQDDDRLLLQYGETVVSFEGGAVRRLLPALLPLLDGTRSVDEIVQIVGPPVRRAVEQALDLLERHGLLTEAAAAMLAESERRSAEFLAATDPAGRSPAALFAAIRAARVAVAGSGSLALEVASSLRRSGVDALEQLPLGVPGADLGRFRLGVAAPAGEELPSLPEWNRAALTAGLPWLQVLPFDGLLAAVGPLYVPRETACYECFRIRRASNVDCGRDFLALQAVAVPLPASASVEQTVAGLAATMALRRLAHEDPFLPGTWYALELAPQPALGTHILYRVPRCPACSGLAEVAQPLPWHRAAEGVVSTTPTIRSAGSARAPSETTGREP
jgi:bacteriocin biosynthesis cyclodehydratase domain-containing protein